MTTVTLDDIARTYLYQMQGKTTLHGYVRVMSFLIDFLRKFSLGHAFLDQRGLYKVDEKKSLAFPEGFLFFTKISFISGDRLINFQRDNSINLYHSFCEDAVSATNNQPFNIYQSWPYNGGSLIDNSPDPTMTNQNLGRGHNGLGYFRINWTDREIQFSSDIPSPGEIYMEWKSNGFLPRTKSTLPEFAKKLAMDYCFWQAARVDRRLGDAAAETEARRVSFLREYDDVMAQLDPIDAETIRNIQARSFDVNKIIH